MADPGRDRRRRRVPQSRQGAQRISRSRSASIASGKSAPAQLRQARGMLEEHDPELRQMADDEVARLEPELARIEEELKVLLLPKDPNDEKNVVLEIRAGTGGDEATLFAAEVFRMYSRYAETQRWKIEVTSASESAVGRLEGSHRAGQRQQGLQQAEVRKRRASRAARAGHRAAGPRAHFGHHRGGAAGSRRSGSQARSQGYPHRYVLLLRARAASR